tara:strand:+ start:1236 stop:2147 length:912 start_codon:yes stop_codon:yes gene_type:complete
MKIFDCTTYFDEPMMYNLRLNILDKHIDEFVVCEALYTHKGEKKKINFDKNLYPKFKNRITHLIVRNEPEKLTPLEQNPSKEYLVKNHSSFRLNAAKRIEKQRNEIAKLFDEKNNNDWIIYSDSDEIPNLSLTDLSKIKHKIVLFNQSVFYYKFNLMLPSYEWFGSKACLYKNLSSISDLRNIKTKKYNWWRLDTFFKKDKFINLHIAQSGGWHFTEIKNAKEIYNKHKNDEHHDEFDLTDISEKDIENMIKEQYIPYDHTIDKKDYEKKWNKNNRVKLLKVNDDKLPSYLLKNRIEYLEWLI